MPPLMLLAATLLPDLLRIFASDKTGSVGDKITEAVKNLFGTDDKAVVEQKLKDSDGAKAALQLKLAEIAAEATQEQHRAEEERKRLDLEFYQDQVAEAERARESEFQRYRADLEDRGFARERQTALEVAESPFAWVAPLLAFCVTCGLLFLMYLLVTTRNDLQNKDVFNALLGAITTAFITIVNFYFGSSASSKSKDDLIATGRLVASDGTSGQPPRSPGQPADGSRPDESRPDGSRTDGSRPRTPGGAPAIPGPSGGAAYPIPRGPFALFREKAPGVMRRLMSEFGLSDFQAAGILGNIGHECAGFRTFQEGGKRPGSGGWGWLQWTGPRRREFEDWTRRRGLDASSDEANYGFLSVELNGSEGRRVLGPLRGTANLNAATEVFMREFERPGEPLLDSRIRYANMALAEYRRA